jgi:DNA polymerase-3 subunit epsilon
VDEQLFDYPRRMAAGTSTIERQQSFDDLGIPLHQVTFCVIDLETTGGSPHDCAITEIGGVKVRGGECVGTFQTLVNPGQVIPVEITVLTGITQAMVVPAPPVNAVLPSLLEFIGHESTVIVGHNVRFDLSFLRAAIERWGGPPLSHRWVDTAALARRLLADEVPNHRLSTLSECLRLSHRSNHRALDDALATTDLLHVLIERASGLGVLGLDDLLELPTIRGHQQASKLKLTTHLPRTPGVYLFRDHENRVLYVGKASNLRSRVRSYFSSETRRKVPQLLRETRRIEHIECTSLLQAEVLEVQLIHRHMPRFNRQSKRWSRYVYLKLTTDERFPRFSVVRTARDDGGFYLGPLASQRTAREVADAVETVVPLRRCTKRPARNAAVTPCLPAQLGVAACPCSGITSPLDYHAIVQRALRGLTTEPWLLVDPLGDRMRSLATDERFEEAADARNRGRALTSALRRQQTFESVRSAGRIVVELPEGITAEIVDGQLARTWPTGGPEPLAFDSRDAPAAETGEGRRLVTTPHRPAPLAAALADEVACVTRYLEREAHRVRLVHAEGQFSHPTYRLPVFEPARREGRSTALGWEA